ncbi:MAG: Fe-S protein assembly chaperone HscA [Deltaproteobacteria bacterium]|nr:Fe-S protein assembly chaperone HscA [Deltaproteobacteria bacterium]
MPRVVGIDLGTTNSLVGFLDEDGRPQIVPDPSTESPLLPSAVSRLPDGSFLVGETARRRAVLHPRSSILSVKRFMGLGIEHVDSVDRAQYRFAEDAGPLRILLDAEEAPGTTFALTPPEVSSLILRELKRRAEQAFGEEVLRAVITVPAYFNDSQRQATRDAGRLAGIEVLRLVNEPTAAALAYGLDKQEEALVAVFDLGGGTFDVSLLQLREGLSEVLATGGDTRLGGDDFDRRIVDHFREKLSIEGDDTETFALLVAAAERAKRVLTESPEARVEIPLSGGTRIATLSRGEFTSRTADLVERTLDHCRRALGDAGKSAGDVDHVILVGGATRMPMIREAVKKLFGREPYARIDPDVVVALGASVQAGILSGGTKDMLLLDVVPLSLGIETMGGVLTRLIDRNTTIPAAAREQFTTAVDNQTHVEVHVLQGERELAKDCRSLARFRIPIPRQIAGLPRVEVTFLIDANGILSVSARDLRTNAEHSIEVKPSYGLTDEVIERMLEESFDLAEEDFTARLLIEARTEAETLLHATERAVQGHAGLLDADERAAIDRYANDLRAACAEKDHNRIRDLIEVLNDAGRPLAERIMNASIKQALESKSVGELSE